MPRASGTSVRTQVAVEVAMWSGGGGKQVSNQNIYTHSRTPTATPLAPNNIPTVPTTPPATPTLPAHQHPQHPNDSPRHPPQPPTRYPRHPRHPYTPQPLMLLVNPEPTPLDFRVDWPTATGNTVDGEGAGSTSREAGADPEPPGLLFTSDKGLTWVHLKDGNGAALYGTLPPMATAAFVGGGECAVFDEAAPGRATAS